MAKVPVHDSPVGATLDRIAAVVTLLACLGMVTLLASVHPDPRGVGTHEQLGMPPCSWVEWWQLPCPTCGVTTAATRLVHLDPIGAVVTQPFGAVLAAAGLVLGAWAAFSLIARRSFVDRLVFLPYGTLLGGGVLLLLGAWLYKYLTFSS